MSYNARTNHEYKELFYILQNFWKSRGIFVFLWDLLIILRPELIAFLYTKSSLLYRFKILWNLQGCNYHINLKKTSLFFQNLIKIFFNCFWKHSDIYAVLRYAAHCLWVSNIAPQNLSVYAVYEYKYIYFSSLYFKKLNEKKNYWHMSWLLPCYF